MVKELGGAGGDWEVISSWNGQQSTLRVSFLLCLVVF